MSGQSTATPPAVPPKLALIALIALVIAGLAALDRFLANAQDAEVRRLAEQSYLDGRRLRQEGKIVEAIEALRKAHALERRNTEHELELIDALIATRKADQAQFLVRDVLEREPNNGRANLLAAHLMIANGKAADAEFYYHRAVYGEWRGDAAASRVSVRMELADFLARRNKQQELLAELLPLQAEVSKNPAAELHLARLFLAAGSPSRAANEFRTIINQNATNATAYAGLGEAELSRGEYRLAHEAFLAAAAHKPDDPSIRRQLELSSMLIAVDPTPRKLTSTEKYRRSLQILNSARSGLERCAAKGPALKYDRVRELLTSANRVSSNKPRRGVTNEIAEEALSLAEEIWQTRIKICGEPVPADEQALRLVMQKLSQ
ncbi:MAG TPA: tetratricopeptide repeat protein [Bryobacteraceae bacterium]|jgi:tetratricopeptide (TPR) repeat protein